MIIFPAVDLKDGQCVRLKQGLADQVTVFSDDPTAMARHWADLGAKWLHVVDLDGAFEGTPKNAQLVADICAAIDIPVQLGGGIRDKATAKTYLDAGVSRLIIGTIALTEPDTFADICAAFPGTIGVSLDAVDGRLKTKGWVEDAGLTVRDVLPRLKESGAAFIIYTDIARDGMQSGVNIEALTELVQTAGLPVIAAGGVATLEDIQRLSPLHTAHPDGFQGAITGRAIYAGTLDLAEAMRWLDAQ